VTIISFSREAQEIQVHCVAGLHDGAIGKVNLNARVDRREINTVCIGIYIMAGRTYQGEL
jgi:hypothetical protein